MSWAALYYAVPLLMDLAGPDTGWSVAQMSAAYSGSLVVAALLSPSVGRMVDRRGPRVLVSGGVVIGAFGLVLVSQANGALVAIIGMCLIGCGQAATLYPSVFAALTIWHGERAATALTVVSLFGGASSAVLAPLLAPVAPDVGWRTTLVLVAGVYVVLALPVAWWGLNAWWNRELQPSTSAPGAAVASIVRSRRFRAAQVTMVLIGVALYAVTLNLIPLATERGHSYATAALAFGLVGLGQVVGRLLYLPMAGIGDTRQRTAVLAGAAGVVVLGLVWAPGAATLMVAATAAGAVRGAHTLTTTLGVADRWGRTSFGALSGAFQRPVGLGIAVAPFVGAWAAQVVGGFRAAAAVFAVLALAAIVVARET